MGDLLANSFPDDFPQRMAVVFYLTLGFLAGNFFSTMIAVRERMRNQISDSQEAEFEGIRPRLGEERSFFRGLPLFALIVCLVSGFLMDGNIAIWLIVGPLLIGFWFGFKRA